MSRHNPSPAVQFTNALVRCQVLLKAVYWQVRHGKAWHVTVPALREVHETIERWKVDIETGRVAR